MTEKKNWTEDELTLALALYLRTPYARISPKNPEIADLAVALRRTPGSVSFKLGNFASLDRRVAESGHRGFANVGHLDREIWNKYIGASYSRSLSELMEATEKAAHQLKIPDSFVIPDPKVPTERRVTIRERRYQNYFREIVMGRYDHECLVTGLRCGSLLEVAHIVAWSEDPSLRLVWTNGLPLNPLIHRAYDANLLGIDPSMIIHVSKELLDRTPEGDLKLLFENLDGKPLRKPMHSNARPDPSFLERHYEGYLKGDICL
jgi:putative restriction endonuclease